MGFVNGDEKRDGDEIESVSRLVGYPGGSASEAFRSARMLMHGGSSTMGNRDRQGADGLENTLSK